MILKWCQFSIVQLAVVVGDAGGWDALLCATLWMYTILCPLLRPLSQLVVLLSPVRLPRLHSVSRYISYYHTLVTAQSPNAVHLTCLCPTCSQATLAHYWPLLPHYFPLPSSHPNSCQPKQPNPHPPAICPFAHLPTLDHLPICPFAHT